MSSAAKKTKINDHRLSKLLFNKTEELIENFSHNSNDIKTQEEETKKSVWHDEDDDIEVGTAIRLQGRKLPKGGINEYSGQYADLVQHKYKLLVGTPNWARLDNKLANEDGDLDILQSVGHIAKVSKTGLHKGILGHKRLTLLNSETRREGPVIKAIEFHPKSSVALVAGLSGIASLLTVDGHKNEKLHSIAFKEYPIQCARFSLDGSEAFLGSNVSHFYVYDLMNAKALRMPLPNNITKMKMFELSKCGKYLAIGGRFGEVHLLCAKTREYIHTFKQNGTIQAMHFHPESSNLFTHGTEGYVTIWDLSTRRAINKWYDDGCITGTSLAISPSLEYVATGSAQGVVNVYKMKDVEYSKTPKPQKIALNLTTPIHEVKFNPSSEILAFMSANSQNAIRLMHIPSFEIFQNFPGLQPNFAHCNVINFSPNSGYMSFGNNKNLAYLYRLNYFKNY